MALPSGMAERPVLVVGEFLQYTEEFVTKPLLGTVRLSGPWGVVQANLNRAGRISTDPLPRFDLKPLGRKKRRKAKYYGGVLVPGDDGCAVRMRFEADLFTWDSKPVSMPSFEFFLEGPGPMNIAEVVPINDENALTPTR